METLSTLTLDLFDRFMEKTQKLEPVLVLGDIGLDKYTQGEVHRISPEAPVPVLEVQKEWIKLGLAANVTDNLKELGVSSTLTGVTGDDLHASMLEEMLEEIQLKTWGIVRDAERSTTFKERVTTPVQQICRIDYESKRSLSKSTSAELLRKIDDLKQMHSCLIIEDYGKGLCSEDFVQQAIQAFHDLGKCVYVDPSRTTAPQVYRGADLLKPNLLEARLLAQALGVPSDASLDVVAETLIEKLGVTRLVITLGPQGMALFDPSVSDKLMMIPTVAAEVFDVSGAGDTAISALALFCEVGASLIQAAWAANCASGVVVGKKGTAKVSPQELRESLHRLIQGQLKVQ